MNVQEFIRNTSAHSFEDLEPYLDQHVAWSEDGTRVLAHAPTLSQLYEEIDRQGLSGYVLGFIPSGGISELGGGLL
jgi:hypothetical protein